MCCISCRDTSEPREIPSSTSTVWVRIGGMVSGRPAIAAMPTAIMAPEINPPGRLSRRNSAPPAVPIASVSSTLRILMRLGMANAIGTGIWLTPPYGKSRRRGQMRQRNCSNARPGTGLDGFAGMPRECGTCRISRRCGAIKGRRITDRPPQSSPGSPDETRWRMVTPPRSSRAPLLRLVGRGFLAFGHELLSLLAVQALAIGFLGAFERGRGTRLVGLLFRRRRFCSRSGGGRGLCERGAHQEEGRDNGCGRAGRYSHHGKHLGLKKSATSRWDAEPKMNAAARAVVWRDYIFTQPPRAPLSRAAAALGWGVSRPLCPRETKDDHSSKNIMRNCGVGFCRACGDIASAGPDRAGMQCEISGRQDRRHAQRPEVERFP